MILIFSVYISLFLVFLFLVLCRSSRFILIIQTFVLLSHFVLISAFLFQPANGGTERVEEPVAGPIVRAEEKLALARYDSDLWQYLMFGIPMLVLVLLGNAFWES